MADLLQSLTDRRRPAPATLPLKDVADLVRLCDLLLSRRGEASGAALATLFLDGYEKCSPDGRTAFLHALLTGFGPDRERLDAAVRTYLADPTPLAGADLHEAAEPRRQALFRRLNMAPGGTLALVRLREDLLARAKAAPELLAVDRDLVHLFSSWFNRGFLELKTIDWSTSATVLERIIRYESVHEIADWEDLRRRLQPEDRRCFGFFHPQMPDEPLIFVEVALSRQIMTSMRAVLDPERPVIAAQEATTAVFYSISNCQAGLRGISFGNLLIKQVVSDLKLALPRLTTFVTLSPVPGFRRWLSRSADGAAAPAEPDALRRAAAAYLLHVRRDDGSPDDPVARFHLGNGARLEQINLDADPSTQGMAQSFGVMVNYLYDPAMIEENHERFADGREVVASAAVRKLAPAAAERQDA